MTDFPSSLSDAVDAVSTERWTPEGLESEALERVSQQRINAVVETRISASPHIDGPFAGVPVTIKEAIEVTGFHHTWGLLEHRSTIAQRDAPAVARLRRAGANIIGTTNVAEMLGDFGQTDNPVYGSTLNPWDLSRTPGGSSGGAAAAVAAGLSFLDLGTDVAGSIRIPAAMCGVVGLKPTPGLVPTGFHPPGADDVRTDLDFLAALGPITRTATDIRLALDVLSDRHAPSLLPVSGLRVGVLTRGGGAYPEDSILAAIDGAARTLTSDGIAVRHVEPGPVDFTISGSLFAEALDLYFAAKSGHADAGRIRDLLTRRKVVIAQWSTLFDEVDALIMPVTPVTAPPHDLRPSSERSLTICGSQHPYAALASWTRHATIAGLPALSVPVALDPGRLPIGLQLVGPPDSDGSLIDLAIRLAELGHTIPLADYPDGTSVAMPRYPSGGHMSER